MKGASNYLRNQTLKNLLKAIVCILLIMVIATFLYFRLLTASVGYFEEAVALLALAPLVGFFVYLRKYHVYLAGWEGEKRVIKLLKTSLNDDFYLINGLRFGDGQGDVDHVILGSSGVFALETKNWSGRISCDGDNWERDGKRHASGSTPSEQSKRNARRVKHAIEASGDAPFHGWVEPVVVFTNDHARLQLINTTVPVLKIKQLPSYIIAHKNHNNSRPYSREEIERIADAVLKQSK